MLALLLSVPAGLAGPLAAPNVALAASPATTTVNATSLPDLVITSLSFYPAQPQPGQFLQVTATILDQGSAPAGNSTTRFTFENASPASFNASTPSLAPGQSFNVTGYAWNDGAVGNHSVTALADATNNVTESNETNNAFTAVYTVRVYPPPANDDFANATALSALPASTNESTMGATLQAYELQPCGLINATVWYTFTPNVTGRVRADTFGSAFDTVLAAYRVPANATVDGSTYLACDDDTARGPVSSVFFDVRAGDTYALQAGGFDGATGNLTFHVSAIAPLNASNEADLVVAGIQILPPHPAVGQNFTVIATVKNVGNASVNRTSTDIEVDPGSPNGSSGISGTAALAPGQSTNVTIWPFWVDTPGYHSVVVTVDSQDVVVESNESNNAATVLFQAGNTSSGGRPDLVVSSVQIMPAHPVSGQQFRAVTTVRNVGNGTAGNSTTWFSVDPSQTHSSQGSPTGSLPPGWSVTFTEWLRAPATAGNHTLVVTADGSYQVAESNESNNQLATTFAVVNASSTSLPDLMIAQERTVPANPVAGRNFSIVATVANVGNATANASTTQTRIFSRKYDQAMQVYTPPLAPGEATNLTTGPFVAPAGGSYFLGGYADVRAVVRESNESNNDWNSTIVVASGNATPLPDLTVVGFHTIPATPVAGANFTVVATIANVGNASANASKAEVLVDPGRYGEGYYAPTPPIPAHGYVNVTAGPFQRAAAGNHTLFVYADTDYMVRESNETNNYLNTTFQVGPAPSWPLPDLVVTNVTWWPANLTEGRYASFEAVVSNVGNATANWSLTRFAMDGQPFWNSSTPSLVPGNSTTVWGYLWRAPAAGNHTLTVTANADGRIRESNASNDVYTTTVVVRTPPPPANDDRGNASRIWRLPTWWSEYTTSATTAPNETLPCGMGATVWYRFTPRVSSLVDFDTYGSSFDTVIAAYQATAGRDSRFIGCNDDAGWSTRASNLTFAVHAGQTYYIQVGGWGGATGLLRLHGLALLPDPAVVNLTVVKPRVRTDYTDPVVNPLRPLNVTVEVANRAPFPMVDVGNVTVVACPRSADAVGAPILGGCHTVGRGYFRLPGNGTTTISIPWRTAGSDVGDYQVCAVVSYPGLWPSSDDRMCKSTYVVAGGTGLGGIHVSP